MKTSGLFTVHSHTIKTKPSDGPLRLVLFGDIHRDSPNHARGAWREFLKYAKGLKNAKFLLMGDALDSTSTSERGCLEKISDSMHDTFRNDINQLQEAKCQMLARELEFMRGNMIGILNGNHYFQFPSGINSDQRLCQLLGARYLGVCAFINLVLDYSGRQSTVHLFVHHGTGGSGRLPGGAINRVNQLTEWVDADIVATGHDHKRGVFPANPILRLEHDRKAGLRVRERQRWLAKTGSFLASYEPGTSNYNIDAMRGPSSLGHVEFELSIQRDPKREGFGQQVRIRGVA